MIKENEETILQLGANMRTSCLRPDLFAVHEARLETLCLCIVTYYFICLGRKHFFLFLSYPIIKDSHYYGH